MKQTWTGGGPANFVLHSDGEEHGEHGGDPVQWDENEGSGVGGSSDDAAAGCREAAAAGTAHLGQRVQATPNVRKDCTRAAIAESPTQRAYHLQVEEAGRRGRTVFMHALGGGNGDKADASHRRMDTQELIQHVFVLCGLKSFARSSTAWQHGQTTAPVVAEEGTRNER